HQRQQALLNPTADPMGTTWRDPFEGLILYREAKILIEGSAPPDDPRLVVGRAYAFAAIGAREKAQEACERAAQLGRQDVDVQLVCAGIHIQLGQFAEAVADCTKALDLAPTNPLVHTKLARILSACRTLKLPDVRRAVALVRKAVELAPTERILW